MRRISFIIVVLLSGVLSLSWAFQPGKDKDKNDKTNTRPANQIVLRQAERLYFNQRINPRAQFLVGDVILEHKGAIMYCDSALYYQDTKSFDAFGHVRMIQGDTLSLVGEILYYDGVTQIAQMRKNVVLKHRGTTLETDSLDYNRSLDWGYYDNNGKLTDKDNQLTSLKGEYWPSTREAMFYDDVVLLNPLPPAEWKSKLVSRKLHYNAKTGVAHVSDRSNIFHDKTCIITDNGYYHSKEDFAYLLNRSIVNYLEFGYFYSKDRSFSLLDETFSDHVEKRMVADSMHYDGKSHISKGFGNIEYNDFVNKNQFFGNYGLYNDSTSYAEAADSALCIDFSQKDSMFVHADTFKLYSYNLDTDSVYRMLHAFHHVRAYRADIQAVCDSMVYDGRDSCATMYDNPIVWQGEQQILGEEIKAWMNDSTVDSVYVINQALMVEKIDSVPHYNQVASTELHSYFREGELYLNEADRNVFINYHPYDSDSLLIGMVHAESSKLRMYMDNRKVQKIWMPQTQGTMYPLNLIKPEDRYLKNFMCSDGSLAWFDYIRPKDRYDVFNWVEKKGNKLEKTKRRELPRQSWKDIEALGK